MIILLLHSLVPVLMSIKLMILQVLHLLLAAARAGHDNIVATLIGAGADVNKVGGWDIPLTVAAKAGHHNIVAILIGAGADVNKADHTGAIPLTAAAKAGHDNIVAILIGAGADVNKADHTGDYTSYSSC